MVRGPTVMRLEEGRHHMTLKAYHWIFLAQPPPLPETMIGHDPEFYMYFTGGLVPGCRFPGHVCDVDALTVSTWLGTAMKDKIDPALMKTWTDPYVQSKDVILAALEDYVSPMHFIIADGLISFLPHLARQCINRP